MRIPIIKILDYKYNQELREKLETTDNPMAMIVKAQLKSLEEKGADVDRKFEVTKELIRQCYKNGYTDKETKIILNFFDWVIRLPEGFKERIKEVIKQVEEEFKMEYVPIWLRDEREEGIKIGEKRGEKRGVEIGVEIGEKRGKIDRNIKNLPSQCEPHFFEPHSLAQVQRQFDSFLGFLDKSTNILTPQNNRYYLIDQRAGQYRVARKIEELFDVSHGSLINNYFKRIYSLFYTYVDSPHTYNLYNKNTYSLMPNYFLNLPYAFKSSESNSGNLCVLEVPVGVDGTPKDDWQTIVAIDLNKGELNRRDILPINSIDLTPELINQFLAGEFDSYLKFTISIVFFLLCGLAIYLLLGIIYRLKKIFFSQKVKVQRINK